ncbi:hypothetical protein [Pleurocapsa sp. FMAR1]|uniref:hypothetical protein n=1 Tax=Pleurocapsa sp. FMAR1 TaxID=3040204 RepID=UPI0029C8A3E0|nr:hypothetical protein [Pleurocapsa sp. FMAR1]
MTEQQRAIGIFENALDTEAALKKLDKSHFSLEQVFVIARNTEKEEKIVDTQLCESLRARFNTRISSVAQDSNITGDETVMSLANALIHLDIPVDTARIYNDLVAHGEYLLMVEGNTADLLGAEKILTGCGVRE